MAEVLVHLDSDQIPLDYVMVTIEVPEDVALQKASPDEALAASRNPAAPVYVVPSTVVPQENNIVLFPKASGFRARVIKVEPFQFDERLFTRR